MPSNQRTVLQELVNTAAEVYRISERATMPWLMLASALKDARAALATTDETRERNLLNRAVDVMAALHRAIEPMENDPELAGRVPPAALRTFVDALADIDRERCQLRPETTADDDAITSLCDRLDRIHKIALDRVTNDSARLVMIANESEGFMPIPPCSICKQGHAEPEQDCPQLAAEKTGETDLPSKQEMRADEARDLLMRAHSILMTREAAMRTAKGQALLGQIAGYLNERSVPETTTERPFQYRVVGWALGCFGSEDTADRLMRTHRFLEEALELAQACGCTKEAAAEVLAYVYGRPTGVVKQEAGGTMVSLAVLCEAFGFSMDEAGETELARVLGKVEEIRVRHAGKPKFGSAVKTAADADAAEKLKYYGEHGP